MVCFDQCFHNRLFKNPFTISKIPFFPQNFLATQTVEKIKKIQANLRQMYHRLYEKASIITLPEKLSKLSRVPSMKVSVPHICLCSSKGVLNKLKVLDNGGGVVWQKP
jgi:hypothetical protein